jgi:hypothetical protein
MKSFQLRVGSQTIPQRPVNCGGESAEAYLELMKAFHSVSAVQAHTCFLPGEYIVDDASNATTPGSFLIGLELSSFAHKSDTIFNGTNTLSSSVMFEAVYDPTPAAMVVNFFARYDCLLVVNATTGLMESKF